MKEIGRKIYYKIPVYLRWIFWPAKLTFRFIDISRLNLWILSGEESTSHQKLSIVYAGTESHRNYFTKMAYGSSFSENFLGRVWIWKIFRVVKEKSHNCCLKVVAVNEPLCTLFRNRACFNIPFWVSTLSNISPDGTLFVKRDSVKTDIRKIRNNKLSFEITHDSRQFDNFYYNMYRPYITQRHGDGAIIVEHDYMKNWFKNSELLLIKKENEYIAGAMLEYKKKQAHTVYLGVKDGNFDYVKDGAVGAVFYFAIRRFREKGYKEVDFGGSRAFLKDGVLRYKKRRGASQIFCSSPRGGIFFVEPLTNTPGLKAFLINNPFIFIHNRKINGAVFVDSNHSFSREELEKIYKMYYFDGMSKLSIYQFGRNGDRTQKVLPLQFSGKIRFCSAERLFEKHN